MNVTVVVQCTGERRLGLLREVTAIGFSADYNATDVRIHGTKKTPADLEHLLEMLADFPDKTVLVGQSPA